MLDLKTAALLVTKRKKEHHSGRYISLKCLAFLAKPGFSTEKISLTSEETCSVARIFMLCPTNSWQVVEFKKKGGGGGILWQAAPVLETLLFGRRQSSQRTIHKKPSCPYPASNPTSMCLLNCTRRPKHHTGGKCDDPGKFASSSF